jgi:predicted AlkP superfamily pyrophosphatase or phosphodiesterase
VPDVYPNELFQKYGTASLFEEFKAAGIPYEKQEKWCKSSDGGRDRDIMYTQMLIHVLKKHRPNLALLHLVEVDHVEHATGPRSTEAYGAVHFEDQRIGEIRAALEETFPGRATVLIVSDHGFIPIRQKIQPNVKLRQAGLLKTGDKATERRVFAMDQGGASFIYVLDKEHRTELITKTASLFKDAEGIDQVITSRDYNKWGMASPEKDSRMPDIVLTAKDGYTFSEKADDDALVTPPVEQQYGAHGHSPLLPDMYATFIAWGDGIKKGKLKEIQNIDVAPTAAALLGLKMKNVQGHVLQQVLAK